MRTSAALSFVILLATSAVACPCRERRRPKTFRSGRNFSAWIGLVPKQHSSGGRDRLGSISKQGDRYLRSLFVAGALAVVGFEHRHEAEQFCEASLKARWKAEQRTLLPHASSARIRSCLDARTEIREVLLEAFRVLGPCHLVDAGRGELLQPEEARPQNIDGEMMQERR